MQENRMQRKWILLLAILVLLILPASAANVVLFHQNYSALGTIPSNVIQGYDISPEFISNLTMVYNTTGNNIEAFQNSGNIGNVYVVGFYPQVLTTYNIRMDVNRTNLNSMIKVYTLGTYTDIQPRPADVLRLRIYYYDAGGVIQNPYVDIPSGDYSHPFTLSVHFNGTNKSYTSAIGAYSLTAPLYDRTATHFFMPDISYDLTSSNIIKFMFANYTSESNLTLKLYDINQTVLRAGVITAIGNITAVPLGFDSHPYWTFDGGVAILDGNGSATYWADDRLVGPGFVGLQTTVDYVTNLLTTESWDLGIHYNKQLSTLNTVDYQNNITRETANITTKFGQAPTTWCSLSNNDNVSHAVFAYSNEGQIWRNYWITYLPNVGNLYSSDYVNSIAGDWPWWYNISNAGGSNPVFIHETDNETGVIPFSVKYSYFSRWVQNYVDKGKYFTPFNTWYQTIRNTNISTTTFTAKTDLNSQTNFSVSTENGYSVMAFVDVPYQSDYAVKDDLGASIPYQSMPDGNLSFLVKSGRSYVLAQIPSARFLIDTTSGIKPFTITVNDTTNCPNTTRVWDFGDGTTSSLQNLTHTYTKEGRYTITLTAINSASSSHASASTLVLSSPSSMATLQMMSAALVVAGISLIALAGFFLMLVLRGQASGPVIFGVGVMFLVGFILIALGTVMVNSIFGY